MTEKQINNNDPVQGVLFDDSVPALMQARKDIDKRIQAIQDACAHPNYEKTAKSDTGNWCRGDDRYWYELKCSTCLKQWTEDQ